MRRFFQLCIVAIFLCPALAQAQSCDTPFEVITTLRPLTFGFPTVWDAKYGGEDSMLQLGSGIPQEGGTVLAIGRSLSLKDFRPQDIVLVELNRRGRALKEQRYPAKEAEEPVKMIRAGKEFVALSNMRGGKGNAEKWARLSWYDADGKYKREKIVKDAVFDFEGKGLVEAVDKGGFIAVLHGVNRGDPSDENGVLMRFYSSGELVWRRAYRPGIPNMLTSLNPVTEKNYLATGRIRLDDGRIAGWAMKLGFDGAVQWQRTYPRGSVAAFESAALVPSQTAEGKNFILAGEAKPYDGGPEAAWIMEISATGEPIWQRYYRRPDAELRGDWVRSEEDGRIVLMMNAKPVEGKGDPAHVRMLTLSPRGGLIGDEAYYEGMMAQATDYVPGWNSERIMTAVIEEDMNAEKKEDGEVVVIGLAADEKKDEKAEAPPPAKVVHRGWVFVATALDPYVDPCAAQRGP